MEFHNNVKQLFHTVVTDRNNSGNAQDLLNILLRKVTLPLKHYWEDDHLMLVYYNVSLDIVSDLSSMEVSFNSDYTTIIPDLRDYDTFQLAEFVLALERDIPKWRHIWLADDELRKKKAKMSWRIKTNLRVLRHCLLRDANPNDETERNYRISFYNVKAAQLMLDNDNPCWENQHSEADILTKCQLYHTDAPIEQWYDEWTHFIASCQAERSERERKAQELHDRLMKMRHLINLKHLKLEAFLKNIELHDSVTLHVEQQFDQNSKNATISGRYNITLSILGANTTFFLKFDDVDGCIKKLVENFKRINDIVPELQETLNELGPDYYLQNLNNYFWQETRFESFYIEQRFDICLPKNKQADPPTIPAVNNLNSICNDIFDYINDKDHNGCC